MYRDDACAVCGESLPPDHFYCRDHAATVDDRLHELGALLPRVRADLMRLAELLDQTAEQTWDYLAEQQPDDPDWPPVADVVLAADADEVSVDVDSEPGYVQVRLQLALSRLLSGLTAGLADPAWERVASAAGQAEGANATH